MTPFSREKSIALALQAVEEHLASQTRRYRLPEAAGLLFVLALAGCGDAGAESEQQQEQVEEDATNPAVMLVGQVYSPDNYFTYVGALPEVPEGDVSFENFREFGNANAYTHGGYVFVEEEGTIKRFSVNKDLELVDGPEFSWLDYGVAETNASYTVFVSKRRAYTLAPELGVVLVWDPEEMIVTGDLPFEIERPLGMETWAYDGYVVGDKVIWNVFSGDFDSLQPYPALTLIIADAESDELVRIVEDSRCLPGGPSRVDDDGNYYVHGGGYYGLFFAYGDTGVRTCMLRVNAGETSFDPDFLLDYEEATGSAITEPWIYVAADQYITRAWDPEVEIPVDSEAFWGNPAFRPLLVDTRAGTAEPYSDFDGRESISGANDTVDGVSYFQLSETGYVEGGNTDVFELRPEGTVKKFHLSGFLLGLKRIR